MKKANLKNLNSMLSKSNSCEGSVCNCGRPNSPSVTEILK